MSLLYVFATIGLRMSLGMSTAAFVGSMGCFIAWRDRLLRRVSVSSAIIATSIGLGLLFHYVFTEVFELGL